MIQLNLLPDVKIEYLKAQRSRRLAISISLLVCAVTVGLLIILLGATGLQKKHLNDLSADITADNAKLQKKPQVEKILTVQNQLDSLPGLHAAKPEASRLFGYLNQVTPAQVDISELKVDFTQQKITLTGTGDALSSVNKYIDTLKFTTFTTKDNTDKAPAFSNIVMTSFGLNNANIGRPATYTIDLNYDKIIFDLTQEVELNVPNLTTTRSALDRPSAELFQAGPSTKAGGN